MLKKKEWFLPDENQLIELLTHELMLYLWTHRPQGWTVVRDPDTKAIICRKDH